MGGARGVRFDRFGGNRVGWGGGNIDQIDQIIKLFFFLFMSLCLCVFMLMFLGRNKTYVKVTYAFTFLCLCVVFF